MEGLLELFLMGLTLGVGPCSLFCLPLLLPYIAGAREDWLGGLRAALTFSLSRLTAYMLLGLLAGLSGRFIALISGGLAPLLWLLGSLLVILLGILILLGGELRPPMLIPLSKLLIEGDLMSMGLLGFIVGITPCAPLLGVLTYITLSASGPLMGALSALCFGLGSALITPIIALGVAAGLLPRLIFRDRRVYSLFRRVCGALLILLGVRLMASQLFWGVGWW
ncbi:MAG: Cytochrome c biogenesis protein, transmembrane region [Candidatus Bathyarchaeota archaeon B23]|nr:MAG: Cytochrome c biogenesis protein, transmembrane region [Candidatus Bathyarchaeota archaeon B23]